MLPYPPSLTSQICRRPPILKTESTAGTCRWPSRRDLAPPTWSCAQDQGNTEAKPVVPRASCPYADDQGCLAVLQICHSTRRPTCLAVVPSTPHVEVRFARPLLQSMLAHTLIHHSKQDGHPRSTPPPLTADRKKRKAHRDWQVECRTRHQHLEYPGIRTIRDLAYLSTTQI